MGAVVALDSLLDQRRLWKGQPQARPSDSQSTGYAALDAALPIGGWPESALIEILLPAEGMGELQLLWPTLARLTGKGERIALVAPPHVPYPQAWQAAGVDLRWLSIIEASGKDALWAAEQCLRSGCCAAVLCWPQQADDRALRRLQVAAETGQTLAFAYRPLKEAMNPSPAALRIALEAQPAPQLRVLKCRGGLAQPAPIPFAAWH
ncbi:translesion DNA synthesis-associated protein ImuA [Stutzerimonas nitrititolerans]|uniref:translesion DNA synthesis-associated protein ImuA n=1 Tax=Stutzerimonas nitrititolerans TaxID=2482751 RepID=UPI001BDBFF58|nr:translesion DNA synthesis-associated protein ImuA [Stutzerimonas nitrititolerans]MBT1119388.1 translesion DNA synthesis-associated protein ImuA [Stutzerimonas nitrititolerans]